MPWMYQPVSSWSVKNKYTPPPLEECRRDVTQATCAVVQDVKGGLRYPAKATTKSKLIRILGYVLMAAASFKRHASRVLVEVLQGDAGARVLGLPPQKYLDDALDYLLEDAQKNMSLNGTTELEAGEILREHEMFPPRRLKVVAGRGN
jgi:hypothetical protein